ncbi:MAG: ribosomal protein S18-alanine N-acetyltransferase [Rubrivivax sp.]|jgi:ribosomal-protein-alanine N-acetyltransferase|nr:ribosomal protein S18-alanine N-acetyltransferase [Rubrivivax sp.]
MSARPEAAARLRPMRAADVADVAAIEARAYAFPWSRGNFVDSLAAGYLAEVLVDCDGGFIGYLVAMPGVDEMHLLNITVAPECQRRGWGSRLLDRLEDACRARGLANLWLEVRESNVTAQALYRRRGFAEVGRRRRYYPAPRGTREDAIVMSLTVPGGTALALV